MSNIIRQCLSSQRVVLLCLRGGNSNNLNHVRAASKCPLDHQTRFIHSTRPTYRPKDYYQILGIARNASARDIKKAYIALAKRYHPDANPGNTEMAAKFSEVAEAYTVLSNRQQRAAYDADGSAGDTDRGFDPIRRSYSSYESFHSSVDPEELFRKIFGADFKSGDFMKKSKRVWVDYAETDGQSKTESTIVRLTFREAAKGCEKVITAKTVTTCEKCMGLGAEPGRPVQMCPFCEGVGYEIFDGHDGKLRSTCRFCHGKGHNVVHKCSNCLGYGKTLVDRSIVLPIPAGILDGETMKVNVDAAQDDLDLGLEERVQQMFITFRVDPSSYFTVDEENGVDLHSEATISLGQAIFGGRIKIDGLYTDETIEIEAGTNSHFVVKLEAKGLKKSTGFGYGDHYVHLKIEIPKTLTEEQRKHLVAYAELEVDTSGEINGIKKRELSTEKASDPEGTYSATDREIDYIERKRMASRSLSQNPWFIMLRETIATPLARQLRMARILITTMLSRDK